MTQKEKNEIIKILENTCNNYTNAENDIVCVGEKLFNALSIVIQELKQETVSREVYEHEYELRCNLETEILHLERIINNRWIPVEEALPNRNKRTKNLSEDVQVTVKHEFGIAVDVAYYNYAEKKWHTAIVDGEVLAWEPLPQPYNDNLCDTNLFDNNKFGG